MKRRLTLPYLHGSLSHPSHGFWCLMPPLMVQESSFLQGNIPACLPLRDPHSPSCPPFPLLPQLHPPVPVLHKLIIAAYKQVWMASKFNPPTCLYLKKKWTICITLLLAECWGWSSCSQDGSGCKGVEERKHSLLLTFLLWILAKENEAGIKNKVQVFVCPALSSASNSLPPPCGPSLICE